MAAMSATMGSAGTRLLLLAAAAACCGGGAEALGAEDLGRCGHCPLPHDAYGLAVAFWSSLWAEMGCAGAFEAEVSTARVLRTDAGSCVVLLMRPSGELRLDLSRNGSWSPGRTPLDVGRIEDIAVGVGIKGSSCDPWEAVTERLCLLTSWVGSVPLATKTGEAMQPFAAEALNAARAKARCGHSVHLEPGSPPAPMRAAVTGHGLEARFPLRVCLDSSPGPCHGGVPATLVEVALQVNVAWNRITNGMTMSLQFLGAEPEACAIGKPEVQGATPWLSLARAAHLPGPGTWPDDSCSESRKLTEAAARSPAVAALEEAVLKRRGSATVPATFDFLDGFPECATPALAQASLPVYGQGLCASSHVLAAIGAWQKQICAVSAGRSAMFSGVSAQWPLQCAPHSVRCLGGRSEDVFALFYVEGAVPEACAPYLEPPAPDDGSRMSFDIPDGFRLGGVMGSADDSAGYCREVRRKSERPRSCPKRYARGPAPDEEGMGLAAALNSSRMSAVRAGRVRGERMIQAAILAYGAVVAIVDVYADFLDYNWQQDGVYERASALTNADCLGRLAVQLVGWGTGRGLGGRERPYWLGEASFGPGWGSKGRFRWLRGEDHLGIERQAWHPLVDGLDSPGMQSAGARAVDELSALAERRAAADVRLSEQLRLRTWLIAVNITSVVVMVLAGCCVYIWPHAAWPFDAPSASAPGPGRARQYRYSAVPGG